MDGTRWWKYVQSVAGADTQAKDIADTVGIDKSNVTRWKQGSRPAVEFVLKFARRYGRPVVEALANAEYITDGEANLREVKIGVDDLSDVELAAELLRRAEARDTDSAGRRGHLRVVDVVSPEDTVDVVETPDLDSLPHAAKRGTRKADAEPWAE